PVGALYLPWLGVADTNVSPAGSRSLTLTWVAAFGPALVRVTVKATTWPTLGRGMLTLLASRRSACCGVTVALAVLLAGVGSTGSAWRTVRVLVGAPGLSPRAWMVSLCGAVVMTVPTAQMPVAGSKVPWEGVAVTTVSPGGIASRMVTFVAVSGPRLLRLTV